MKYSKSKRLRPAGAGRYGAFLSVGSLLGIAAPGLRHAIKLEFLPQWGEEPGHTDAVLSKRSLLVDVRLSDVTPDTIKELATLSDRLSHVARERPGELLDIVSAFGRAGSKEEREKALGRAENLGLWIRGNPEPAAMWVGLLLAGAAILIAGCCQETDTSCDSDDGGTDGGTDNGDPDK